MSQTFRRVAATLVAALLATVAMLTAASVAQAATLDGETEQGKNATLQVRDKTDIPARFAIRWKATDCSGVESYRTNTIFKGFERATETKFRSSGSYGSRESDGYRSRVRVRVEGEKAGKRRWTGSFSAQARIFRNGDAVGSCSLKDVSWKVSRGG